jgi:hypothetical protein
MDKFGLQGNFSAPTSCFMPIVHMNANPQYISAGAEKMSLIAFEILNRIYVPCYHQLLLYISVLTISCHLRLLDYVPVVKALLVMIQIYFVMKL